MQEVEQNLQTRATDASANKLPVSVIIPVRNEARNLPRCLASLQDFAEVHVVDSQSTDATIEIAREYGAQVTR
jgi:glycosyltransferase involved in cell wall biosynthesis